MDNLSKEQLKRLKEILKKESVDYYFFNPKEGNFILSQSERIEKLEEWISDMNPTGELKLSENSKLKKRIAELEKEQIDWLLKTDDIRVIELNNRLTRAEKVIEDTLKEYENCGDVNSIARLETCREIKQALSEWEAK